MPLNIFPLLDRWGAHARWVHLHRHDRDHRQTVPAPCALVYNRVCVAFEELNENA
jgi:hypothetical protein